MLSLSHPETDISGFLVVVLKVLLACFYGRRAHRILEQLPATQVNGARDKKELRGGSSIISVVVNLSAGADLQESREKHPAGENYGEE